MPNWSNDILLDMDTDDTSSNSSWIDLDLWEDVKESNEETNKDSTSENEESKAEDTKDTDAWETDEEDIDLDAMFAEIDDANDAIEKIESNKWWDNSNEIWVLKDSLSKMEQMVKKLTNDKADLIYRNAELEAFGWDWTDPKILLLSRNLAKANDWDDKAKTKTISLLKDMLYNLTWEDYEQEKINKDADMLSAVEQYNSVSNPNLKTPKTKVDDTLDIF